MASLSLASTAFLLPGNAAWAPLTSQASLQFCPQGQWQPPTGSDGHVIVWFWEQLLPDTLCLHWHTLDEAALIPEIDDWLAQLLAPLSGSVPCYVGACTLLEEGAAGAVHPWLPQLEARFTQALTRYRLRNLGLGRWLAEQGRRHCSDERNRFLLSCPLSMAGLASLANWIATCRQRAEAPGRKVLVLDCDNTLWGGVIGEDGLAGLALGQDGAGKLYQAFQEAAVYWQRRGVLLALCSKNAPEDVWLVFEQHGAMRLRREQIAAAAIGWEAKSHGLRAIATTLNLGLDALVLWDDSPLERAEVRSVLPQVEVIEPPAEIWAWPGALLAYGGFPRTLTRDDTLRQASYQALADGERLRASADSEQNYLATLALRAALHPLGPDNLARAGQLTQKTNQFNLACRRHEVADIETLAAAGWGWLVSLQDRFAAHGLVGLVLIARVGPELAFLDTLVLSCRVLSRGLEYWLLSEVAEALCAAGVRQMIIGASRAERNAPALAWLESLPLTPCDNPDPTRFPHEHCYALALDALNLPFVEFYRHD